MCTSAFSNSHHAHIQLQQNSNACNTKWVRLVCHTDFLAIFSCSSAEAEIRHWCLCRELSRGSPCVSPWSWPGVAWLDRVWDLRLRERLRVYANWPLTWTWLRPCSHLGGDVQLVLFFLHSFRPLFWACQEGFCSPVAQRALCPCCAVWTHSHRQHAVCGRHKRPGWRLQGESPSLTYLQYSAASIHHQIHRANSYGDYSWMYYGLKRIVPQYIHWKTNCCKTLNDILFKSEKQINCTWLKKVKFKPW